MEKDEILATVKAASQIVKADSNIHEFDININEYEGHFKVKHPSLLEQIDIGVRRAKLINGAEPKSLDILTDNLSYISATLVTVILEAPTWFDLTNLDDYDVLLAVYNEYKTWNDTFRRGNKPNSSTSNSKTSTNEGSMDNNENVPTTNK